jgi:GTP-binding protein
VSLDPPLPEVALLGRSNVGKSCLLNALVGRRIAKVSATPGKTRSLNVFLVDTKRGEWGVVPDGAQRRDGSHRQVLLPTPHAVYVLDLPGYGYARASQSERAAFRRLIGHTLDRPRLAGVVWLLDIRHEPSDDDRAMQDALAAEQTRVLAALTKSDKLARGRRLSRAGELSATLRLDLDQVVVTSARTGEGIPELRLAIAELVRRLDG